VFKDPTGLNKFIEELTDVFTVRYEKAPIAEDFHISEEI